MTRSEAKGWSLGSGSALGMKRGDSDWDSSGYIPNSPMNQGQHRCHTHEEAGTHCPRHWPGAGFVPRAGRCQETHVASSAELGSEASGRKGAGSETHGGLSSLDSLEVSQQARHFTRVEGDREAALCQGTGWDHETREDPPVPEGWVGKGVLAFSFHEGRTRHREGQPFIQETQQLGRPMVNRLHPYLGFLPRLPGEEEGAAECPDLSLPCPRLRCKFGKSVPSLPPTQGL